MSFSTAPANPIAVNRTSSQFSATFVNSAWRGAATPEVFKIQVLDSVLNCSYDLEYDHHFPGHSGWANYDFSPCDPIGTLDTLLFYFYHPTAGFYPTVTAAVTGGSVIQHTNFYQNWATGTDTFVIQWTSMSNRYVHIQDVFQHTHPTAPSTICTAEYDFYPTDYPEIIGRQHLCGSDTATYAVTSIPNATYVWTITGGTIVSGQGTSAILVNWNGPGTLQVDQSFPGCSGVVYSAVMTVTFGSPTANLGPDVVSCQGGFATLNAGAGTYHHLWNTGANTQTIQVNASGNYSVQIADAHGCSARDTINVNMLTDCVWPGDANHDGVANQVDVLSIGNYMGTLGTPRTVTGTAWTAHLATDWGGALPGLVDPKHSDSNGNGVVAFNDTMAVLINFGNTHPKSTGATTTGAALQLVALEDSILSGDMAHFELDLGSMNLPVDSIHGLALVLGVDPPNSASFSVADLDAAWFAPLGSQITLTKRITGGDLAIAVSRIDGVQQTGGGLVASFSLSTNSNVLPEGYMHLMVKEVFLMDGNGYSLPIAVTPDSVYLADTLVSAMADPREVGYSVFPNPAHNAMKVTMDNAFISEVAIIDQMGRLTGSPIRPESSVKEIELTTAHLPAGAYSLQMRTSRGPVHARFIILR